MTFPYDANLPWGWWLIRSDSMFEDADGRRWDSVREAFWHGRLRFPVTSSTDEQLELLLRLLLSIEYRLRPGRERAFAFFHGDLVLERFYMSWLASVGLLGSGEPTDFDGRESPMSAFLSAEGRAAMLMLQATREPAWVDLPASELLDAIAAARRDDADEARERAIGAFETAVRRLPNVFERARIGSRYVVTLTGHLVDARMPTRSRMWSLSFGDERARDDFFAWLAERVASWEDWGRVAYDRGAAALTDHLLALFVAAAEGRR